MFFEGMSEQVIPDELFARLLMFPNLIITGHQGFFIRSAPENISQTTMANIQEYENTVECRNEINLEQLKKSA